MRSYIQKYIPILNADGFQWDDGNLAKCQKHGLTKDDVEAVFFDVVEVAPDIAHSQSEARQLAIGRTAEGRPAFVVFTLRVVDEAVLVRPLSARYMHDKEFKRYERPQGS